MEFYGDRYYDNEVNEETCFEVTNDITERALSGDVFFFYFTSQSQPHKSAATPGSQDL